MLVMSGLSLGHLNPFRKNKNLKPLYKTDQYNGEVLQTILEDDPFRGTEEDKEAYETFIKRFQEYKIDVIFKRCPECQVVSFWIDPINKINGASGVLGEGWRVQLHDLCPVRVPLLLAMFEVIWIRMILIKDWESYFSGKCPIARKGFITKCLTKPRKGRLSPSTITLTPLFP